MSLRPIIFSLLGALLLPACVSTGSQINDRSLTSKILVDQSTNSDVAALLGLPEKVTYDEAGGVTWQYFQITKVPKITGYLPLVRAWADGFDWQAQELVIHFDPNGVVKSLERQRQPAGTEPILY
jgi:hypothetical protein